MTPVPGALVVAWQTQYFESGRPCDVGDDIPVFLVPNAVAGRGPRTGRRVGPGARGDGGPASTTSALGSGGVVKLYMNVYLGQTRARGWINTLESYGFGEMVCRGELPPRRHPWAYDNGAFKDWTAGAAFNEKRYLADLDCLHLVCTTRPDFLIPPDRVGGGARLVEVLPLLGGALQTLRPSVPRRPGRDDRGGRGCRAGAVRGGLRRRDASVETPDGAGLGGLRSCARAQAPYRSGRDREESPMGAAHRGRLRRLLSAALERRESRSVPEGVHARGELRTAGDAAVAPLVDAVLRSNQSGGHLTKPHLAVGRPSRSPCPRWTV